MSVQDRTSYTVLPDVGPPDAPIPTFGAATTVVDQYRVVEVHTDLPAVGAAFTDTTAAAALAKIAEGGIASIADLEAAEAALQALLLHEQAHVLTWAPKVQHDSGLATYKRFDQHERSQLAFELFSLAASRDWIIAPEFGGFADGVFRSQTLPASPLNGLSGDAFPTATYWNDAVADAVNVAIEEHGVPAYLTHPGLMHSRRGDGFAKRFYHHLRLSWDAAVGGLPPVVCTFALPPMLAIVLDRLNNRADLQAGIEELRAELAPVRSELLRLNDVVTAARSNADIEGQVRYVTQSFDAVMHESRLSNAERFQRRFLSIQRLVRPLIRFAAGFLMSTPPSSHQLAEYAGSLPGLVLETSTLIDRTVTAKAFSQLVRTESLQSLVRHHLSNAEIAAIERSIRQKASA